MRIFFFSLFLFPVCCIAQNSFKAIIKGAHTQESLAGVSAFVEGTRNGATADANGFLEIKNIAEGKHVVVFSSIGYLQRKDTFQFPMENKEPVTILLSPEASEIEEVVVEATRSNRSIENIPTRVETLTEEIDEASTMDPSKVAHLLTHSTGIQVQQTSATSNTANVRIQGLDGRYTQILKDGFPLYGGFSGSLSIMQIPPLDLRQIEYVKSSASTLYGGGAIAGLINLLSKTPDKEENIFHLNASHVGAFDVNAFTAKKFGKLGYTLLAQRNTHEYFDVNADGFTDLPELTKYNFNPRLFLYPDEKTKMYAGATFTTETKKGGDTKLMNGETPDSAHFYKEENDISRITTQIKIDRKLGAHSNITAKNSFNFFDRTLGINSSSLSSEYFFSGKQLSTFSEISFDRRKEQNSLIVGLNYYSDRFDEQPVAPTFLIRHEYYETYGAFAQYTFDLGKKSSIESGLRADYVMDDKAFILPRLSALFKWSPKFTSRIGGGMGYRNATLFNQEAEMLGYKNIFSINKKKTDAEQSYGGNADIGFKTPLGEKCWLNINQMFFYTVLDNPIVLGGPSLSGMYEFVNAKGFTQSYGAETFFKLGFYDFVFFAGYTYTHAHNDFSDSIRELTLTPVHSLKGDLLYALLGKWRIGVDYEYKSSQFLSNGKHTREYWTFGAVVEYTHKQLTLFGNIENFTDVRQTKFESLLTAPYGTPQFTEVWAPLDGMVFNAGIKIRM